MTGRTRCRMHGGTSLRGPASATWKHGRYSTVLPKALRQAYGAALDDPNIGSVRNLIALYESRLADLTSRLSGQNASQHWTEACTAFHQFMTGPDDQKGKALAQLRSLLEAGAADEHTWSQIDQATEVRRRLTDTEGKNLERLHQTLTADQAMTLILQIMALLRKYLSREKLSRFGQELQQIHVLREAQLAGRLVAPEGQRGNGGGA